MRQLGVLRAFVPLVGTVPVAMSMVGPSPAHGQDVLTRPNERTPDFIIELARPVVCVLFRRRFSCLTRALHQSDRWW